MEPNQEIVDYIKARKEQGVSVDKVTKELNRAGWDKQEIKIAIHNLFQDVAQKEVKNQIRNIYMKFKMKKIVLISGGIIFFIVISLYIFLNVFAKNYHPSSSCYGYSAYIKSTLSSLRAEGELYYDLHNGSYEGFCLSGVVEEKQQGILKRCSSREGVERIACNDESEKWCAYSAEVHNNVFCVDSQGSATVVLDDNGCNQYFSCESGGLNPKKTDEELELGEKITTSHAFEYTIQDNSVYYEGNILKGVDYKTFEYLDGWTQEVDDLLYRHEYYKDINNIYLYGETIPSADVNTFEFIEGVYSRDKNNVFYFGTVIADVDQETFTVLDYGYTKDKNHVYFAGKMIEDADSEDFNNVGGPYYQDANHTYFDGKSIQNVDNETFIFMTECEPFPNATEYYAKDKYYIYHNAESVENIDVNTPVDQLPSCS